MAGVELQICTNCGRVFDLGDGEGVEYSNEDGEFPAASTISREYYLCTPVSWRPAEPAGRPAPP